MHLKKAATGLAVFSAGIAAAGIWYGNRTVGLEPCSVVSSRLPEEFSGFTIAQVSDLHNAEFGQGNARLLRQLRRSRPDVIAITGDLIDSRRTNLKTALEFAGEAVKIAPVLYVPGNHESRIPGYERLKTGLEQLGVRVLHNKQLVGKRGAPPSVLQAWPIRISKGTGEMPVPGRILPPGSCAPFPKTRGLPFYYPTGRNCFRFTPPLGRT